MRFSNISHSQPCAWKDERGQKKCILLNKFTSQFTWSRSTKELPLSLSKLSRTFVALLTWSSTRSFWSPSFPFIPNVLSPRISAFDIFTTLKNKRCFYKTFHTYIIPICRAQAIIVCLRIPSKGVLVTCPEILELIIKLRHRLKNMNVAVQIILNIHNWFHFCFRIVFTI